MTRRAAHVTVLMGECKQRQTDSRFEKKERRHVASRAPHTPRSRLAGCPGAAPSPAVFRTRVHLVPIAPPAMYKLLRRISSSFIPRPDRPWSEDGACLAFSIILARSHRLLDGWDTRD